MSMLRTARRGFSLLELTVTIGVMLALVLLLALLVQNFTLIRIAREQDIALRIVETKLDAVRAAGYAAVPLSGSFSDPLLAELPSGAANLETSDYNAKTKQVVARVSWQSNPGLPSHEVELTTLVTSVGGLP